MNYTSPSVGTRHTSSVQIYVDRADHVSSLSVLDNIGCEVLQKHQTSAYGPITIQREKLLSDMMVYFLLFMVIQKEHSF